MIVSRKSLLVVCYCLVLVSLSAVVQVIHAVEKIRLACEEYAPYVSADLPEHGLLAQIAKEAFKTQGIALEIEYFPAKRAFMLAKDGMYDGSMPWAKRDERLAHFHYGEAIIESDHEVFFHHKDLKFKWDAKKQDYSQLSQLRIGAIQGSNYGKKFQDAEKRGIIKVLRVLDTQQCFQMLYAKRIDLFITPERIAHYANVRQFKKQQVETLSTTLAIDEAVEYDYLLISKRSPHAEELLKAMNTGLKTIKANGRYKEIILAFELNQKTKKSNAPDQDENKP